MRLTDLEKYVGHYISFGYAIFPPPWKTEETDCDCHIKGTLIKNSGRLSHYAIKESGLTLRDDMVGLIINFEDKGINLEELL